MLQIVSRPRASVGVIVSMWENVVICSSDEEEEEGHHSSMNVKIHWFLRPADLPSFGARRTHGPVCSSLIFTFAQPQYFYSAKSITLWRQPSSLGLQTSSHIARSPTRSLQMREQSRVYIPSSKIRNSSVDSLLTLEKDFSLSSIGRRITHELYERTTTPKTLGMCWFPCSHPNNRSGLLEK